MAFDAFSRMIAIRMTTDLPLVALGMSLGQRAKPDTTTAGS